MKKDWKIKKLEDICELITKGTTPTSIGFDFQNKGINFVKIESFSEDGTIIENKVAHISKECHEALKRSQLQKGDILFSIAGALGRTAIIDESIIPANTNQALAIIRLQNKDITFIKFLLYYFKTDFILKQIEKDKGGVAQQNLSLKQIGDFEIPVPPLEEQKRIVKILDEKFAQLESLKANAQTNLQNAKDLFQSQLAKAFSNTTWEKKRLGDSSELITKGSSPKWQGINYVTDDGILFVTSENVRENYIDLEKSKYLEKKFNDKQKRSILKKNDVLVNIVGASIGRAAIFDFDIVDANINQAVALIRSKNEIDVHFLSYFLNSDNAMNQYNNAKKDTARANLSLEDINNLRIPLPPLPEQKRIVKELDTLSEKVRQLQEIYTKQLDNCDELKQAFLAKAFAGEL